MHDLQAKEMGPGDCKQGTELNLLPGKAVQTGTGKPGALCIGIPPYLARAGSHVSIHSLSMGVTATDQR